MDDSRVSLNSTEYTITAAHLGRPSERYPHLLCHCVLPYSNAEWAIPCQSESSLSLKTGAQDACWAFGGVAEELQTDQSSTATHRLRMDRAERVLNEEYKALCAQWDQIFHHPMTAMAAADRLVHHGAILEFTNESLRAPKGPRSTKAE